MTLNSLFLAALMLGPAGSLESQEIRPTGALDTLRAGRREPRLYTNLGTHQYRITTGSPRAQQFFNQGLRLLWAFNHAEAVASFEEAERLDPGCALCAAGQALALGPNINAPMDQSAVAPAIAAVERARQLAAGATAEERALIEALGTRYSAAPEASRAALDSAYARALRSVADRFPESAEVQVLLADGLMNLSPWNYWNPDGSPRPDTEQILSRLENALDRNPDHPGACHLFIHAVEARDPARALPCAERLAELMPGAGHLVHMPGHIFIRVGRYADAIEANRHATHADASYLEGPVASRRGIYANGYYPHNWHFLSFAASLSGRSAMAIDAARRTVVKLDPVIASQVPWLEAVTPVLYWTLVTFGKWDAILAEPLPPAERRFTTGMAYYARGIAFAAKRRFIEAHAALDTVAAVLAQLPEGDNQTAMAIAEYTLAGEIALRQGKAAEAVRQFRAAAALEDGMAYNEPPIWYYPVRHSLGKALLAAGRAKEAEQVYREDLTRFPSNGWSLLGLAISLERQGRVTEARRVRRMFSEAWKDADVQLKASRF
jgi:tetratricopeptide (TPR) repeat protein